MARGWPAQVWLLGPISRCSIGVHFEPPVGSWPPVTARPYRSHSGAWRCGVQTRERARLLPPLSATISRSLAVGYAGCPASTHQRASRSTANRGGVGRRATGDRAPVPGQVGAAGGDRSPQRRRPAGVHGDRLSCLAPDSPSLLELAEQRRRLGVDAELGEPGRAERLALLRDGPEVLVAVRLRRARLERLGVGRQPIRLSIEPAPDGRRARRVPGRAQVSAHRPQADPDPRLLAHRVPSRDRLDQLHQRRHAGRSFVSTGGRPPPGRRCRRLIGASASDPATSSWPRRIVVSSSPVIGATSCTPRAPGASPRPRRTSAARPRRVGRAAGSLAHTAPGG